MQALEQNILGNYIYYIGLGGVMPSEGVFFMEKGWIKLHRRVLENVFLMHDDNAFSVFTKLLMMVGREKGQWAGGRHQLGELMNLNHRTLYGVLIRLERQQLISIESNNRYSTITICNWNKYQSTDNNQKDLNSTARQQPRNNHATTTQHSNKNKKENKKEKSTNVLVNPDKPDSRVVSRKDFLLLLVKELGFSDKVMATDGRLRKLSVRLNHFSAAQMVESARNLAADAYMQGDNDSSKRYGTIDYFLRSDEIVDKYLTQDDNGLPAGGVIDESRYV